MSAKFRALAKPIAAIPTKSLRERWHQRKAAVAEENVSEARGR